MNDTFTRLKKASEAASICHELQFFRLQTLEAQASLQELLESGAVNSIYDTLDSQLRELLKIRNPSRALAPDELEAAVRDHLGTTESDAYGVWVFYPWSGRLVHLVDADEYAELRTSRNKYKITAEEQALLATKRVGVIGLSVGQTVALTLAMERGFGELRLADFDVLELSNMNRIRSGAHDMGNLKVVNAAREIAEIDPFLKVVLFPDGITDDNLDAFLTGGGPLDVLVEECDGLDVKISSRLRARAFGIPVVMDTSDRGLIDVERFDLEPNRPIFHGLIGDVGPQGLKGLSNEEKIPLIHRMVNLDEASPRMRQSMAEVRKTITTWPQLASGVVMGGAIAADVTRRILLGQYTESGRYYMDPEHQIADGIKALYTNPLQEAPQN